MEQGTEEWFAARLGKITASRVKDVMARTKSGPAATRKNYMMELLCQRLTGQREESFTNAAMARGTELEPIARSAYEILTDETVTEVGFGLHPGFDYIGASPDGLVGDSGMLEIKCPNTASHIACIQSGKHDSRYTLQMQCQMACFGREWCDFASFDDRLPEELQLFVVRVARDDELIGEMLEACAVFERELFDLEQSMLDKISGAVK